MKLVKVTYQDLAEKDHVENINNVNLTILSIFGYLIEDEDIIRVIKEIDVAQEDMQVMVIPKSCVLEVRELTEGEKVSLKS
jgi:hypothetical protein